MALTTVLSPKRLVTPVTSMAKSEEAAEVNVHYQVMKLVEDIADEERDSDEKYLDKDDVVEYMMAGADRLVRIFSGEAVFPWPKDAK